MIGLEVDHAPHRRVFNLYISDRTSRRKRDEDRHGAGWFTASVTDAGLSPIRVFAIAVDRPPAIDLNVLDAFGVDQRLLEGTRLGIGRRRLEDRVIGVVWRSSERGRRFDPKSNAAFETDGARKINAVMQIDDPAA